MALSRLVRARPIGSHALSPQIFKHAPVTTFRLFTVSSPSIQHRLYACEKQVYPPCSKASCDFHGYREPKEELWHTDLLRQLITTDRCCPGICTQDKRLDDIHYKPTDNTKRKYMCTWAEPVECVEPKKICIKVEETFLQEPKRRRNKIKLLARSRTCAEDRTLMNCRILKQLNRTNSEPFFRPPNCKVGRRPPSCFTERHLRLCKKNCTKYPSFSECKKPASWVKYAVECDCQRDITLCRQWRYYNKMLRMKAADAEERAWRV